MEDFPPEVPSTFTPVPYVEPIDSREATAWLDSIELRLAQIKTDLAALRERQAEPDQIGGS